MFKRKGLPYFCLVLLSLWLIPSIVVGDKATENGVLEERGRIWWVHTYGAEEGCQVELGVAAEVQVSSGGSEIEARPARVRLLLCSDRQFLELMGTTDGCASSRICALQVDVDGSLLLDDLEMDSMDMFHLGVVQCSLPSWIPVEVAVEYRFSNPTGALGWNELGYIPLFFVCSSCACFGVLVVFGDVVLSVVRSNRIHKLPLAILAMWFSKAAYLGVAFAVFALLNLADIRQSFLGAMFMTLFYAAWITQQLVFACGLLLAAMGWGLVPRLGLPLAPVHKVHKRFFYPLHFPDYVLIGLFAFALANFTLLTSLTYMAWYFIAATMLLMGVAGHIRCQSTIAQLEALDPTRAIALPHITFGRYVLPLPLLYVPDEIREFVELRSRYRLKVQGRVAREEEADESGVEDVKIDSRSSSAVVVGETHEASSSVLDETGLNSLEEQMYLNRSLVAKIRMLHGYRFVLLGYAVFWSGTVALATFLSAYSGWYVGIATEFFDLLFLALMSWALRRRSFVVAASPSGSTDMLAALSASEDDEGEFAKWYKDMQDLTSPQEPGTGHSTPSQENLSSGASSNSESDGDVPSAYENPFMES